MTTKRKILIGLAGIAVASVIRSVIQGKKVDDIKDEVRSLAGDLADKGKEYFGLAKERVQSRGM